MDILSYFGETLQVLIADNNLSSENFANAVKIDRSVIYKYLRKECLPSLDNFIVILDYFQCSADFLLGLAPETQNTNFKPTPAFCSQFKKLLADKNITRYRLKKETTIPKQCIDDWYHGKRTPNLDNVLKLANYFHCSVDYLLGRES